MRKTWSDSVKIPPSDITPEHRFLSRRALLAGGAGFAALGALSAAGLSGAAPAFGRDAADGAIDVAVDHQITDADNARPVDRR